MTPRADTWRGALSFLERTVKVAGNIASAGGLAGGARRDLPLLKAAALNLLIASEFPLPVLARMQNIRTLDLRALETFLEDPAVRHWLESWATGARALRVTKGQLKGPQ